MNTLTISKDTPELAEALKNCEVGKPETFKVVVTPQAVTDELLVATVDSVTYDEETETAPEEVAATTAKKPYKPRTAQPSATDVAVE
jgi:hypothetical protein